MALAFSFAFALSALLFEHYSWWLIDLMSTTECFKLASANRLS